MRPITVSVGPVPGAAGNIATAQAATANVSLNLNGTAVAAGVATLSPASQVTISSATGTDAGQFFIAGTDPIGTPHGEMVTMAAGTVTSVAKFATVNRITPLFTPAGNITAGASVTPLGSSPIRLDEWADAPVGVQVSVSGTVNYTVQHSFDDPNDMINPVPLASMFWDTGLVPAGAIGAIAGITFSMATAPLYLRLLLNSGTGSTKMVITQYNVVEG